MHIIRIGFPVLIEMIDLVNYVISNEPTQMANFPTWILDCDSHIPALLSLFLSSDTSIYSIMTFLWLGSILLLSQFPLIFHYIYNRMSCFITFCMTILVLIEMVFVIIWQIIHHGKISLNSVLLLLLVNFVSGYRLELMCISLFKIVRSNLTHLHGFQLLVLLPLFVEITFFCTKRVNLLNQKSSSDRLVIVGKGNHFLETWLLGLLANC